MRSRSPQEPCIPSRTRAPPRSSFSAAARRATRTPIRCSWSSAARLLDSCLLVSLSPRLLVSSSPCLLVSSSPCLLVSLSPRLLVSSSPRSLPNDLDQHPLRASPVEFPIKNLLPRPKIKLAAGNGHDDLSAHDLPLVMGVRVIFARAIVLIPLR